MKRKDHGWGQEEGSLRHLSGQGRWRRDPSPHRPEADAQAREWAGKALKLDETNLNACLALYVQQVEYEWNWAGVEKVGPLHPWYHSYLTASGQLDMALQHHQRFLSEMRATAKEGR